MCNYCDTTISMKNCICAFHNILIKYVILQLCLKMCFRCLYTIRIFKYQILLSKKRNEYVSPAKSVLSQRTVHCPMCPTGLRWIPHLSPGLSWCDKGQIGIFCLAESGGIRYIRAESTEFRHIFPLDKSGRVQQNLHWT